MNNRKRPKFIEKQLNEINEYFHRIRLKDGDQYDNALWCWYMDYLLRNKWYKGYNMYIDQECTMEDGTKKTIKILAGIDFAKEDYYLQLW